MSTITLDDLRLEQDDMNFPHDVLVGCESALVLFAAGFHGRQDSLWLADAGLRATCVDVDAEKLAVMKGLYPENWAFVCEDVYHYCDYATRLTKWSGPEWDVVSADPWTQDFTRCADLIEVWCRLARVAVILGTGTDTVVDAPAGWKVTDKRRRSDYDGGVFWSVLERA